MARLYRSILLRLLPHIQGQSRTKYILNWSYGHRVSPDSLPAYSPPRSDISTSIPTFPLANLHFISVILTNVSCARDRARTPLVLAMFMDDSTIALCITSHCVPNLVVTALSRQHHSGTGHKDSSSLAVPGVIFTGPLESLHGFHYFFSVADFGRRSLTITSRCSEHNQRGQLSAAW